mmetsp:Transcript_70611/g.151300  ORF Transcript_70611/g.151300 Transcript_70611/m.151300 type:complete len:408 (+) Transcript_70611:723-1946(+)
MLLLVLLQHLLLPLRLLPAILRIFLLSNFLILLPLALALPLLFLLLLRSILFLLTLSLLLPALLFCAVLLLRIVFRFRRILLIFLLFALLIVLIHLFLLKCLLWLCLQLLPCFLHHVLLQLLLHVLPRCNGLRFAFPGQATLRQLRCKTHLADSDSINFHVLALVLTRPLCIILIIIIVILPILPLQLRIVASIYSIRLAEPLFLNLSSITCNVIGASSFELGAAPPQLGERLPGEPLLEEPLRVRRVGEARLLQQPFHCPVLDVGFWQAQLGAELRGDCRCNGRLRQVLVHRARGKGPLARLICTAAGSRTHRRQQKALHCRLALVSATPSGGLRHASGHIGQSQSRGGLGTTVQRFTLREPVPGAGVVLLEESGDRSIQRKELAQALDADCRAGTKETAASGCGQ